MDNMMDDLAAPSREIAIDPFNFFPGVSSKIAGLGGNAPGHDHNYVFHTGYFEAAPGPSRFIIQFHGLGARVGTLWLRVHMLPMEEGARAVMANSDRIQLNRLIKEGGRCEIRFEGFRRMSFALYAGIEGETDAEATGVEVWFDRLADPQEAQEARADGRSTTFGRDAFRPATQMLSVEQPSFAHPVSQVGTESQLRESPFGERARELGLSTTDSAVWQQAYVLQVLHRYGMVAPGARGLGLGLGSHGIAQSLAAASADVTVGMPENDLFEAPGDVAIATILSGITTRAATLASIPDDLVDFDFVWSTGGWDCLESPAAAVSALELSLTALRPGGLGVHAGRYRLGRDDAIPPNALSQADVERLSLILISRGHEVAQFRFAARNALYEGKDGAGAVGIIFRKKAAFL